MKKAELKDNEKLTCLLFDDLGNLGLMKNAIDKMVESGEIDGYTDMECVSRDLKYGSLWELQVIIKEGERFNPNKYENLNKLADTFM